jgi:hypothetical protein
VWLSLEVGYVIGVSTYAKCMATSLHLGQAHGHFTLHSIRSSTRSIYTWLRHMRRDLYSTHQCAWVLCMTNSTSIIDKRRRSLKVKGGFFLGSIILLPFSIFLDFFTLYRGYHWINFVFVSMVQSTFWLMQNKVWLCRLSNSWNLLVNCCLFARHSRSS